MTQPTDLLLHPQSQTGRGRLTQESGDAGLSSNMEHKFKDVYSKSAWPVAETGSSVIPIPMENQDIRDFPAKLWPAAIPKSHPAYAEGRFIKRSTVQINTSPPQILSEEETFKPVSSSPALTDGQPLVEEGGEESCSEMDSGPKCPPLAPGAGRISNQLRKRAAGKYRKMYLLCWMAFTLSVSEGHPGGVADHAADHEPACFTCVDKDRCPKLMNIFDSHRDTALYHRDLKETLQECSVIPSVVHNCSMCREQSTILIVCAKDVGSKFDVEDRNGTIDVIPTNCSGVQQKTPRTHDALIAVFVLFVLVLVMVLGALVISNVRERCRQHGLKEINCEEH